MQFAPLRKYQPYLESVLGPLSVEEDSTVRQILGEVDDVLVDLAQQFRLDDVRYGLTGLDLTWMPSGQTQISACLTLAKNSPSVDFIIELRPSWYFGEKSSEPAWEVEISIYADCEHSVDHGHSHAVYDKIKQTTSPTEAVAALRSAADELRRLANEFPLKHWIDLASDARGK